jgi:hypothetical protein
MVSAVSECVFYFEKKRNEKAWSVYMTFLTVTPPDYLYHSVQCTVYSVQCTEEHCSPREREREREREKEKREERERVRA